MPARQAPTTRPDPDGREKAGFGRTDLSRRRFLGYVVAAPTLVVAAEMCRHAVFGTTGTSTASATATPSAPLPAELYDLLDAIRDVARPTANLVAVEVDKDDTVSFALPRSENGQGVMTATQMIIAEEMDLDPDQVRVTLADARPELVFNQLSGVPEHAESAAGRRHAHRHGRHGEPELLRCAGHVLPEQPAGRRERHRHRVPAGGPALRRGPLGGFLVNGPFE